MSDRVDKVAVMSKTHSRLQVASKTSININTGHRSPHWPPTAVFL